MVWYGIVWCSIVCVVRTCSDFAVPKGASVRISILLYCIMFFSVGICMRTKEIMEKEINHLTDYLLSRNHIQLSFGM